MPIRVLSFNIWGVLVATDTPERMQQISERICAEFDIVCFQEQFEEKHYDILFPATGSNTTTQFPYRERCSVAHPIGNGLLIASRYPILSTTFVPYWNLGLIERLWEGEYFTNKGMQISRVQVPKRQLRAASVSEVGEEETEEVTIINTHLLAQFQKYSKLGDWRKERNAPYRLSQAIQLAQVIATTCSPKQPVIVCGDFNCSGNSPEMKVFRAYLLLHGFNMDSAVPHDTVTLSDTNMYNQKGYLTFMNMEEDRPVQLDHVLFNSTSGLRNASPGAVCFDEPISVQDIITGKMKDIMLSDHYGVKGNIELGGGGNGAAAAAATPVLQHHVESLRSAAEFLEKCAAGKRRTVRNLQFIAAFVLLFPFIGLPLLSILLFFLPFVSLTFLGWNTALSVLCGFTAAWLIAVSLGTRTNDFVSFEREVKDLRKLLQRQQQKRDGA